MVVMFAGLRHHDVAVAFGIRIDPVGRARGDVAGLRHIYVAVDRFCMAAPKPVVTML